MKQRKAILYVRVSTDEQADKGHSLAHQEEKLRQYCAYNNLDIVGFYKEDHSAKSFERPQFKLLLEFLKKNRSAADTLLFLKWDRFSRNAPEAYGMLGTLAKLGVEPQAAEQPLNLEVPEQKIMLALYLTAPEVENDRRAMNVFAGMRRAKKEGRYMGNAPYGYRHSRNEHNRPCIVPGKDADVIRQAFEMMATGHYNAEELRRLLVPKGLRATKNTFLMLLRNPVYVGKVNVPAHKDEPAMLVHGTHQPLVTEDLFYAVQDVMDGRKRRSLPAHVVQHDELRLRGFLKCAKCGKNLTGSASKGHGGKYYYYHCKGGCKERFRAEAGHKAFDELLERISGNKKVLKTFEAGIADSYEKDGADKIAELQKVRKEIATSQIRLDNAQTLMLDGDLTPSDYKAIKARLEPEISRHTRRLTELTGDKKDESQIVEYGFYFLNNLPKLFAGAGLSEKHRILGSTFPEKLVFENGECRTSNEDNILMLLAKLEKGFNKKKDGGHSQNGAPSCRVGKTGFDFTTLFIGGTLENAV